MAGVKRRLDTARDIRVLHKELDEVSCPICMDHPHNAVLLQCSSHEKGCRSYICDTSYRHSNCLDRFKKLMDSCGTNINLSGFEPLYSSASSNVSDTGLNLSVHTPDANENNNQNESDTAAFGNLPEGILEHNIQGHNRLLGSRREAESFLDRVEFEEAGVNNSLESGLSLKCPLCRGAVLGWDVVEEARKYLNSKKRSCSRESCSFIGNYQELRRHARRAHPTTRPSDVDPSRERAWRCLEHQREYGDIVSAIRSEVPGAVVVGDYVIENVDRLMVEREVGANDINAPWWTTFFLFQMIGSVDGVPEPRARSRAWTQHRRSAGALPELRFLWGENLLGLQDEDDDDDELHVLSDAGEDSSPILRRRRRLTRSRSGNQS